MFFAHMVADEVEVDVRERLAVVEARAGPRRGHLVVLHGQPVGRRGTLQYLFWLILWIGCNIFFV